MNEILRKIVDKIRGEINAGYISLPHVEELITEIEIIEEEEPCKHFNTKQYGYAPNNLVLCVNCKKILFLDLEEKSSSQQIKEHLLKWGGLIITDRQVGKSQALIEILIEDPNGILIVCNQGMKKVFENKVAMIFEMESLKGPVPKHPSTNIYEFKECLDGLVNKTKKVTERIMTEGQFWNWAKTTDINKYNIYIDDYFWIKNPPEKFAGAVSSMRFPVKIKKFGIKKDRNVTEEELYNTLSDREFRCEVSLNFD